MVKAKEVLVALERLADPDKAAQAAAYFKAQPGGYGAGDVFLGVRVPELRRLARAQRTLPLAEVQKLLRSPYHEARLLALLLLVERYRRAGGKEKEEIVDLYLQNKDSVNNWDLVDSSAPHLLGPYSWESGDQRLLGELAASSSLWERRMAVMATFYFIRRGEFEPTLRLARKLLTDPEELVHKAVGWLLREIGKRDEETLVAFLEENAARMPRPMLRYATEKLPAEARRRFLEA